MPAGDTISTQRVRYEYAIIGVNPPGTASFAAGILVRTVADDRLYARVRSDLAPILDSDSAEIVNAAVEMFVERAAIIGGLALLAELDDTLSNFLTIGARCPTALAGDLGSVLSALAHEHISR